MQVQLHDLVTADLAGIRDVDLAAWIDITEEYVGKRRAAFLSRVPALQAGTRAGAVRGFARSHIDGTDVALGIPTGFSPPRVRYCWADSPVCALFDLRRSQASV